MEEVQIHIFIETIEPLLDYVNAVVDVQSRVSVECLHSSV